MIMKDYFWRLIQMALVHLDVQQCILNRSATVRPLSTMPKATAGTFLVVKCGRTKLCKSQCTSNRHWSREFFCVGISLAAIAGHTPAQGRIETFQMIRMDLCFANGR